MKTQVSVFTIFFFFEFLFITIYNNFTTTVDKQIYLTVYCSTFDQNWAQNRLLYFLLQFKTKNSCYFCELFKTFNLKNFSKSKAILQT